jgi:hypothetical protein
VSGRVPSPIRYTRWWTRRDELDERHRLPVEDLERLSEDDLRDRPAVPDVLEVRGGVSLEERAQVEVEVTVGDAVGEVAQDVGRDVDTAGC